MPPTLPFSWDAPVFPTYKRSSRWYMIAGTIVLILTVYAILSENWIFAVILVIFSAVFYLVRHQTTEEKHIEINENGVLFDGTFTRYEDLKGFWILKTDDVTELHICHKAPRRSDIVIQAGKTPQDAIRESLAGALSEVPERERGFLDMFIRICKI